MKMKVNKIENQTAKKTSHLSFGFYDTKGREIGMTAVTFEFDIVLDNPVLLCGIEQLGVFPELKEGHYFAAKTQATRNGDYFGSSQQPKCFKTEIERDLYLAKRWKESLEKARNLK